MFSLYMLLTQGNPMRKRRDSRHLLSQTKAVKRLCMCVCVLFLLKRRTSSESGGGFCKVRMMFDLSPSRQCQSTGRNKCTDLVHEKSFIGCSLHCWHYPLLDFSERRHWSLYNAGWCSSCPVLVFFSYTSTVLIIVHSKQYYLSCLKIS